MFEYVKQQLSEVQDALATACYNAKRKPQDVKLLAVSKTFPIEAVLAAYDAGQRCFAENRVPELENKVSELPSDINWHLIGHLQSNKVRKALKSSEMIHSVDSLKLLTKINGISFENKIQKKVLLEINISNEPSKFGLSEKESFYLVENSLKMQNINLLGLMTMAPFGANEISLHNIFGNLRKLKNKLESEFSIQLPELSMGMSSDYIQAVAEGATMVRIGTAIFGKRPKINAK